MEKENVKESTYLLVPTKHLQTEGTDSSTVEHHNHLSEEAEQRCNTDVTSSLTLSMQQILMESNLSYTSTFFIMLSMSYGSAVIILPYTIQQLGIVLWLIFTTVCFLVLGSCAVLLKNVCIHVLSSDTSRGSKVVMIRHPYPRIADFIVGSRFSKLVQATMYICMTCQVMAFMLLSATTMNQVLPIPFSYFNRVRIWLLICYIIAMPFFMIGTYKNLVTPAVIAASTSIITTVCIFSISIAAKYQYGSTMTNKQENPPFHVHEHICKIFGEILFAAGGPALIIPNLVVLLKKPEKFHVPIIWTHALLLLIYSTLALVPYLIFEENVSSSIIHTINIAVHNLGMGPLWTTLVVIAEVALSIHFAMVSVLTINPVFLSLENTLNLSSGFGWKRVGLRCSVALILLVISILVPIFEPVISIIGAVPLALLCIIYPILIYWMTFQSEWFVKMILVLVALSTVVLMMGNVVYSGIDIGQAVRTTSHHPSNDA